MPEVSIPRGVVAALPSICAAAGALPQAAEIVVYDVSYERRGGKRVPVLRATPGPDSKGRVWAIERVEAGEPNDRTSMVRALERMLGPIETEEAAQRAVEAVSRAVGWWPDGERSGPAASDRRSA